jgi:RNA-binding proteins (RRM domain)
MQTVMPPPPPPRQALGIKVPEIPSGYLALHQIPFDLSGREPNASTVYVGNINRNAAELDILEISNSIDGTFARRESKVVAAVNFAYGRQSWKFNGFAYFLYTSVELAEYAVQKLHNREFRGRRLHVMISDRRLDVWRSRRGNVLGSSRAGAAIWECATP